MKLFGERVALTQVTEEVTGSLLMPDINAKSFTLGRVVSVGDGTNRFGSRPMWVEENDLVMFQLIGPQTVQAKFVAEGKPIWILHQGDLIAKLTKPVIAVENLSMVGEWILLDVDIPTRVGMLHLPDKVAPGIESIRFLVRQTGPGVSLSLKPGDEVALERGRCQPLEIDGATFAYIHQDQIHGVIG